jgi:hypothetical protein
MRVPHASPSGGWTIDAAGNLYGATSNSSNLTCNHGNGCGCGTIATRPQSAF